MSLRLPMLPLTVIHFRSMSFFFLEAFFDITRRHSHRIAPGQGSRSCICYHNPRRYPIVTTKPHFSITHVPSGTLRIGDNIVVGRQHGKVRAMLDHSGAKIDRAPPSAPVRVVGLRDVPQAGDTLLVVPSEDVAAALVKKRVAAWEVRQQRVQDRDKRGGKSREGKSLAVIVKSDVFGTLSAVTQALEALSIPEVHLQIVDKGVGPVSSGDIDAAAANGAFIVTFNVKTPVAVQALASQSAIPILSHKIIYHLLDDVRSRIVQLLPPLPTVEVTGKMRVLQVF